MDFAILHSYLIPLLPLLGAAAAGFLGARWLKGRSHWPIWLGVGAAAAMSVAILAGMLSAQGIGGANGGAWSQKWMGPDAPAGVMVPYVGSLSIDFFTWIRTGPFVVSAGFFFDSLTAIMLCVVCGIGLLITIFAAGYMKGEKGYFRFFAYLGLFIFSMTCLVLGNNFVMLYLGWEGVGLCSYLLIGYYYEKPAAREAAKKAFLVNRIGDFGFALGIMSIFLVFGTVSFFGDATHQGVLQMAMPATDVAMGSNFLNTLSPHDWRFAVIKVIPFLLLLGAIGKSAQFPLYVWLPDAMEGPTPVSALIHAATMVTAGVYMIVRCGVLFFQNDAAMWTIAAVGTFTALFAATIALRQWDLKKVFAYSTISQLGFMFAALGCLAPVAGIFHLMTHAFFKALLFLASGVVMHAMMGHLDMRKMSGLRKVLPWTNILMLIGCLALAGFPFLSGFFSKDEILHAAFKHSRWLGVALLLAAFLTAYYTFRLYFRVFMGPTIVPTEPAEATPHGSDAHTVASSSAVEAGDVAESGVDQHLESAAHQDADHGHDKHGRDNHGHAHSHEPAIMIFPLVLLAVGAIFAGYWNWPGEAMGTFLGQSPSLRLDYRSMPEHYVGEVYAKAFGQEAEPDDTRPVRGADEPAAEISSPEAELARQRLMMGISAIVGLCGIGLAYRNHLRHREASEKLAAAMEPFTTVVENKYWVDEIYQAAIVEPLRKLGQVFFAIDRYVVNGVVWLIGFVPQASGFTLKLTAQRGSLQGYALSMLFGVVVILLLIFKAF